MTPFRTLVGGAVICVPLCVSAVEAAIVTFTGIPQQSFGDNLWIEDGVTVEGNSFELGYFSSPDSIHLDDSGTGFPSSLSITMNSPIDAISFDILPLTVFGIPTAYCTDPGNSSSCGALYDNVVVAGFRDGIAVAEDTFFMGVDLSTYVFSELFTDLDSLQIMAVLPDVEQIGGVCENAPCAHFNVDNIVVAPVPLPPAIVFFASALALMAALGLRWPARRS